MLRYSAVVLALCLAALPADATEIRTSTTAGDVPSGMTASEIALNRTDGAFFYKDASDSTVSVNLSLLVPGGPAGIRKDAQNNLFLRSSGSDIVKFTNGAQFGFIVVQPEGAPSVLRLDVLGKGNGGVKISAGVSDPIGFFGGTPVGKPTVTGSRGGNAALASLLSQLAALGLITDSTSN